ncbi:MAG: NADH-quinone oxidoreductase subunit J [Deltaproteobacteria bacterium]|nr:NADH-quinone oxidoreductase subunit J [Deltaproteobacteria bacterium]
MEHILFYVISGLAIISALSVILNKNPVYSALSLVGFLFVQAILFVLLKAYFIAIVQVLVYTGAIMVLFVYVVMVMKLNEELLPRIRLRPFSLFLAGLFASYLFYIFSKTPTFSHPVLKTGDISEIGELLFSKYVLPFEVISLLLLVAMVGAVVLNRKSKHE